jgi:hypothetical protein
VESVATYLDLRRDPNTGTNAVEVMVPSMAKAKGSSGERAPSCQVSHHFARYVHPDDQQAKLAIIRKARRSSIRS